MLSGIQTLRNIDSSLQTVKNEIHRIDAELSELTNQLASNRRQQTLTLQEIAKIRLGALTKGSLMERMSHADNEALKILDSRQNTLKKLENDISKHQQKQEKLEVKRSELLNKANEVAEKLANNEADVQASLETDEHYQTALNRARDADEVADEAERKAQESADSLEEKGRLYQSDELFMYLWNRHYSTADYKNYNPITRLLDAWVARKAKYHNNRANYWNIQEIPKRLAQHAQGVREQADALIIDIQKLEEKALKQGGATSLKRELEAIRTRIDKCDNNITLAEEHENSLLLSRAQFASAQDPHMQQCLNVLQAALEHQTISGLRQIVAVTPSQNDDALLGDLNHYQSNFNNTKEDINNLRHVHDQKLNRLKELETVRRNFKRHRFDDARSGFGNDALIGNVMGQFLEGLVNGSELWRVIQRNQRHQDVGAWPDYGSGGLGNGRMGSGGINGNVLNDIFGNQNQRKSRAGRPSPWHWPDSNNGGFRLPSGRPNSRSRSSRGSSGGGFTTGGGF